MTNQRIFISGISSWIGYHAVDYLLQEYPDMKIYGSYWTNKPDLKGDVDLLRVSDNNSFLDALQKIRPTHFLDLSRGKTEQDLLQHKVITQILNRIGCHHGFASTFNACDNNLTNNHYESEIANAQSEYGKYKARCETYLTRSSDSYCTFRFSATHGWAPNRIARTESFLRKISIGRSVAINRGIVQNRTYVGDLAGMMIDVVLREGRGMFHLGTIDHSDEVEFLKNVSERFGYSRELVVEGEKTPTNAVMVPEKIFDLLGDKWERTESQTVEMIVSSPELANYLAKSVGENISSK